jgi:hypothetical protein
VAFLTDRLPVVNTPLLVVATLTSVACSSTEDVVVAGSTTFGPSEKRIGLEHQVRAGGAFNGILRPSFTPRRKRGVTVKTLDLLIATYALSHSVSLLTADADFSTMRKAGVALQPVRH